MILNFQEYLNEALRLKLEPSGLESKHYPERVEERLANLRVIRVQSKDGEELSVSNAEMMEIQRFFRKALSSIADPKIGKIFKEVTIEKAFGIIRVGLPKIILKDGTVAKPLFEVYERTDKPSGRTVLRTGTCFWILTDQSAAATVLLQAVDGNKESERNLLIDKSIDHIINSKRESETFKIARDLKIDITDREKLRDSHQIVLTPAGISNVVLDLSSELSVDDQLNKFLSENTIQAKPEQRFTQKQEFEVIATEAVPKQMNVTPDLVWLAEYNSKFSTWGAIPILSSKLVKVAGDNEIHIKVGKKWLHWLATPIFNTPKEIDRIIRKGDKISLAKKTASGDWTINTGTVTEISKDSRSEYPFVKTDGWDSTELISAEEATQVFADYRKGEPVKTNESQVLSFAQWISL